MRKKRQTPVKDRLTIDPSKMPEKPQGVAAIAGESADKYATAIRNFTLGEKGGLSAAKNLMPPLSTRATRRLKYRKVQEKGTLW